MGELRTVEGIEGEKDAGFGNDGQENYLVTSNDNLKLAGGFLVVNR